VLDWQLALEMALRDLRAGSAPSVISASLHSGLAQAITGTATRIGEARVVLTGGCFQNLRLTEAAISALRATGFEPIFHHRVPPNDGGIALGQAVWAAWSGQGDIAPCA
jgi:hydrogenase maturation protein HypF